MATVSTTLTLVDNISSKITSIHNNINGVITDFANLEKAIGSSETKANGFNWTGFSTTLDKMGAKLNTLGNTMTAVFTLPGILLGKKMYSASTSYETALAGVQKTTGATGKELEKMDTAIKNMIENMPVAGGYVQAAATMQTGAQFGIHDAEELYKFTQTYEKLVASTDIQGTQGAENIAKVLNVTEGGVENVDRFGSTITELGNKMATQESTILTAASYMAGAGEAAGFTTPEILALGAAFSSVGVSAEAGGSAAAKLMRDFKLAADMGYAYYDDFLSGAYGNLFRDDLQFGSIQELQMWMDNLSKGELATVAEGFGMTLDQFERAVKMSSDLEKFANIVGFTAEEFASGVWSDPAGMMGLFFTSLGNLDQTGTESVLATLDQMGITEIRKARLVEGLASNPEAYTNALEWARMAYGQNVALDREYGIFASTQESQNQMLQNKAMNTMADLGDNLVQALQPALDMANSILEAFNGLSEVDQDRIVKLMGALVITGPALSAVGTVAKGASDIAGAMGRISKLVGVENIFDSLKGLLSLPMVKESAAIAGIVAMSEMLNTAFPDGLTKTMDNLANIKVSINQESYDATMAAIAEMQAATDLLAGGKTTQQAQNAGAAVRVGLGTESMYGTALAYGSANVNSRISNVLGEYDPMIEQQEEEIGRLMAAGDTAGAEAAYTMVEGMYADVASAQIVARAEYAQNISELFNGMASQYLGAESEAMRTIENASAQYDLAAAMATYMGLDSDDPAYAAAAANMIRQAYDLGYLATYGFQSAEEAIASDAAESQLAIELALMLPQQVMESLDAAAAAIAADPRIGSAIGAIINDPAILENLDMTQLSGALAGAIKALDAANAAEQAGGSWDAWGQYITQGLAGGIAENTGYITGTGSDIGGNFTGGMAVGIYGGRSGVISAAINVANAAAAAARRVLDIHSPSGVAMEIGGFFGEGFAEGILDSGTMVQRAVGSLAGTAYREMNRAVWDEINLFSGLENEKLLDEDAEINLSDGDIRAIRDLAEREVINRFTTAELHIDFTANNNINSNMDLDGVVSYLEQQVAERLEMAAEGVYS